MRYNQFSHWPAAPSAGLLVVKAPDHIIPHPLRMGGIDQRLNRGVVAWAAYARSPYGWRRNRRGASDGRSMQCCLDPYHLLEPVVGIDAGAQMRAGEREGIMACMIRDVSPFV